MSLWINYLSLQARQRDDSSLGTCFKYEQAGSHGLRNRLWATPSPWLLPMLTLEFGEKRFPQYLRSTLLFGRLIGRVRGDFQEEDICSSPVSPIAGKRDKTAVKTNVRPRRIVVRVPNRMMMCHPKNALRAICRQKEYLVRQDARWCGRCNNRTSGDQGPVLIGSFHR
jgi:hypothetical protein